MDMVHQRPLRLYDPLGWSYNEHQNESPPWFVLLFQTIESKLIDFMITTVMVMVMVIYQLVLQQTSNALYRNSVEELEAAADWIRVPNETTMTRNLEGNLNSTQFKEKFHKPVFSPWMADPELDSGFVYNEQGFIDILHSPFFDVNPEIDDMVEEYVERIIFTLSSAIKEQICNSITNLRYGKEKISMLTESTEDPFEEDGWRCWRRILCLSIAFSIPLFSRERNCRCYLSEEIKRLRDGKERPSSIHGRYDCKRRDFTKRTI
ncbi:hypothetical protein M5K25_017084 [Dendrobium thyrsiflorum]|uniref:Uncharacterized protein n=1 Tax=Dendrobium thyrsiflorum TaxID=117978 RepID=A0ABD0UTA3_DENTH